MCSPRRRATNFVAVPALVNAFEYQIIGRMLKECLDVYVPLVDDHAVDAILRPQAPSRRYFRPPATPFGVVPSAAVSLLFVPNLFGRPLPVEREHLELPLHLRHGGQEARLAVARLVAHRARNGKLLPLRA